MNRIILKIAGYGGAVIGGITTILFAADSMQATTEKSIKEWARNKVISSRTEEVKKLFEDYKVSKKEYDKILNDAKKEVAGRLDIWKNETGLTNKLEQIEKDRQNELKTYRDVIKYDETLQKAEEEGKFIVESWEKTVDYDSKKNGFEKAKKDAKSDYEKGKTALSLISNDGIRDVSEDLLRKEYKDRVNSIEEDEKKLEKEYEDVKLKAANHEESIRKPVIDQYKEYKKSVNDKYDKAVMPIRSDINHKREEIEQEQYLNWTMEERHIAESADITEKKAKEVELIENESVNNYIENAAKYAPEIVIAGLVKKGWSKISIYFFRGIAPITAGLGIIYCGVKAILYGFVNIRVIRSICG